MNKKKLIVSILLILWGSLFCLLHFGTKARTLIFMSNAEQTTGYVQNLDTRAWHSRRSSKNRSVTVQHFLTVAYQVDGVDYTTSFPTGSFGISEGKPATVYYPKDNPAKAVTNLHLKTELPYIYPLMLGLGILFLVADKHNQHPGGSL